MIITKNIILLCLVCYSTIAASSQYLHKGDTIDLISVSSPYNEDYLPYIVSVIQDLGYKARIKYTYQYITDLSYTNTQSRREKYLIKALNDPDSQAILFMNGGGSIDLLSFLYAHPKPDTEKIIIGFSDVTNIHMFVNQGWGWQSIHGVVASFNQEMGKKIKASDLADNVSQINAKEKLADIFNILSNPTVILNYKNFMPLNNTAKELQRIDAQLIGGYDFS